MKTKIQFILLMLLIGASGQVFGQGGHRNGICPKTGGQQAESGNLPGLPDGIAPAQNWLNVFHETFGSYVSANWMLELLDGKSCILQAKGQPGFFLVSSIDEAIFNGEQAMEEMIAPELPHGLMLNSEITVAGAFALQAGYEGTISGAKVYISRLLRFDFPGQATEILYVSNVPTSSTFQPATLQMLADAFVPATEWIAMKVK